MPLWRQYWFLKKSRFRVSVTLCLSCTQPERELPGCRLNGPPRQQWLDVDLDFYTAANGGKVSTLAVQVHQRDNQLGVGVSRTSMKLDYFSTAVLLVAGVSFIGMNV